MTMNSGITPAQAHAELKRRGYTEAEIDSIRHLDDDQFRKLVLDVRWRRYQRAAAARDASEDGEQ
jgi:hypothetical protein